MKELKELEQKIEKRLQEIRDIGDRRQQTGYELNEYAKLQSDLRQVQMVKMMVEEMKK